MHLSCFQNYLIIGETCVRARIVVADPSARDETEGIGRGGGDDKKGGESWRRSGRAHRRRRGIMP